MSDTLVTVTPQEAGFYPDRIELIERRAQKWIDEGVTTSLVLSVSTVTSAPCS